MIRWKARPALLFAALCLMASYSFAQKSVPLKSAITHVQPMTGIVLWSDNPIAKKSTTEIALEYRYCGYDEFVTEAGKIDFSPLDAILDEIAKRNHQAILRFYFCYVGKPTTVPQFIRRRDDYRETVGSSEGKPTRFCDWSNEALQQFTLDFYAQFAERYDQDPRIAFLQTGFGLWAEYHIYDGPRKMGQTFPSKQYQEKFLRHLNREFQHLPWSVSVDAADNSYTPIEENLELLSLGFGVFDDSFLCKQHPRVNAMNWRILGSDRWKRQPAGGEFSYYNRKDQRLALAPQGPNGVSFTEAARQFHITYMIGNDQPRYQSMDRIQVAGMQTGYRFRVVEATLVGRRLRLRVTNDGVAPIYRHAYFAAVEKTATTSLRGLLPGGQLDCEIENVNESDLKQIRIESDAILPTQRIQFEANLGN